MVTWSVSSALNANARKNSCRRSRSRFDTRWRATGTAKTRYGRPERSTVADTSASSIGIEAGPYRTIPRLSPSACPRAWPGAAPAAPPLAPGPPPERLAKHDPHVLDRVVLIHPDVALRLHAEVDE